MKRHTRLFAYALAIVLTAGAAALAPRGPSFDLSWHTIDGGGGTSTGGGFELTGTIGQPEAGAVMSGGDFELGGGFLPSPGPPPSSADISGPDGAGFPDGCVDEFDLGTLLGAWCSTALDPDPPKDEDPPCEGCTSPNAQLADLSGPVDGAPDGCVDAFDLGALLADWCSTLGGNPCGTCGP